MATPGFNIGSARKVWLLCVDKIWEKSGNGFSKLRLLNNVGQDVKGTGGFFLRFH